MEEAKRLASGSFGKELAAVAVACAVPLFWVKSQASNGTRADTSSGTTFFIDFGTTICGVTAGHVYDGYVDWPGNSRGCRIGRSERLFDLRDRQLSRGRNVDIFTFVASRAEAESTGARIMSVGDWPPPAPKENQGLIFAGYPGCETQVNRPFEIQFGYFAGAGIVESVRNLDFSCRIDRENMVPVQGLALPEVGCDLAGLSGAPVLRVWRGDVLSWDLAGIVYQCGRSLVELIKMARADLICAGGVVAA
jgi:hypothetical protein